jgi:hypothetical protein
MQELGGYQELSPHARLFGSFAFVGVACVSALLERAQFKLRSTEGAHWWASNGRDVINALAFAAMTLGLKLAGFGGPIALAITASLLVVLNLVQTRLSTAVNLAVAVALALPVLLLPHQVDGLFKAVLEALF